MEILNGNELIVQGGLEAGFDLFTGYPGSPLADYFNILESKKEELKSRGICVAIANSEANAAAMASGAKQAGRDCLVAMKSMGLNVAADALSVGNFARPGETADGKSPAVVVVVGDDPWSVSTSAPVDSRYLFKHLHIPFLEPANPGELKDWIKTARDISRASTVYQGVLLTTAMAEGGGRVACASWAEPREGSRRLDSGTFDLQKLVMVPPNSLAADRAMILSRFPKVRQVLEEFALDRAWGSENAPYGLIAPGASFETLKQVWEEIGSPPSVALYKVACSWPLNEKSLAPWLKGKKAVAVVEEKRGFLEAELSELVGRLGLPLEIYGKRFASGEGFPAHGGLSADIVEKKLGELFALWKQPFSSKERAVFAPDALPVRLPTFCPGCPHRETLSLLTDLRRTLSKEGVDLLSHGDVGCYSLSFLPPFKEMHNLSAMGQGGALGAGVDLFGDNPSVVLMGDSTFYHSGITDISNSVQLDHNITYILLNNDNTAMTGHQVTPVSGVNVQGKERPRQDMLAAARALGVAEAIRVNPSDRYFYKNVLARVVREKGVKVIVSDKECALTFHGRKKARERRELANGPLAKKTFYQINTEVCEDCRECVELTGCPGLTQTFDAYGPKVAIDPQICVADSYCTKLKACPSFELVEVAGYRPPTVEASEVTEGLPEPQRRERAGQTWRAVVTGVGGSGVTTISRVIAEAAREMDEGLDFKFVDQKGLAQRNGNVTAHLSIFPKGRGCAPVTPAGGADVLLSTDLLDGSRHVSFLSAHGVAVLDEEFQVPLSVMLDRKDPPRAESLGYLLREKLGEEKSALFPLKRSARERLGKSVYASAVALGAAFQKGLLPFSLEDMKAALKRAIPSAELAANTAAFTLGRRLALGKSEEAPREDEDLVSQLRQDICSSLPVWIAKKPLLSAFERNLNALCKHFSRLPRERLARYLRDIYVYDRGARVEEFVVDAGTLASLYGSKEKDAVRALGVLARTYWIKDEVFVAHLLLSRLKKRSDEKTYGALGRSYKVTHINRPHFDLWGLKVEFDLNSRDWMLKIMRHLRLLRWLLPGWHRREREIAANIRRELLREAPEGDRLIALENVKGYREVRYRSAQGAAVESS